MATVDIPDEIIRTVFTKPLVDAFFRTNPMWDRLMQGPYEGAARRREADPEEIEAARTLDAMR